MDTELIILCIAIVILLGFSSFFSVSETGLTAMSRARMHKRAKEGSKKAKLALEVRGQNDRLIGTILVGNNIANIVASMLAGVLFGKLFTDQGLGLFVATVAMTFLVLIFGEVLPKTYAIKNSDKVAMLVAPFMHFFITILSPITKLVQAISNFLLRILGLSKTTDAMHGHDALRGAIELHHHEGAVVKDDRDMLGSILDLSHVTVQEAMAHRRDMESVSINLPAKEIVEMAFNSSHTRLPIWENEEENIIGILITKNVLKLDRKNPTTEQIRELLHEPQFIPETTTLRDQLENFRRKRSHMAIVIDEYGALVGLITLEDILEEIVGQIDDEHDKVIMGIKRLKNGGFIVRGNLPIRDLNREFDWNLPVEEDANTIAGLVIALAQQIPEVGEKVAYNKFRFKVLGKVGNQITSVRIGFVKKKAVIVPENEPQLDLQLPDEKV